jgi:hypothetical protein
MSRRFQMHKKNLRGSSAEARIHAMKGRNSFLRLNVKFMQKTGHN